MARTFLGTPDIVNAGDKAAFILTGDISWCSWMQLSILTNTLEIIGDIEGAAVSETEVDNALMFIVTNGGSSSWDIRYIHEHGAGINEDNTWLTDIVNDTWAHVAIVRDVSAKTVDCYLNSVAQTTFNYTTDPTYTGSAATYSIGARVDGSLYLTGAMQAHVNLANVAWTPGEVRTAMRKGVNYRGLVAYHPLLGASPEPDYSGNGHHGTVTGTTVVDNPPVGPIWGIDSEWHGEVLGGGVGGVTIPIFDKHYRMMR